MIGKHHFEKFSIWVLYLKANVVMDTVTGFLFLISVVRFALAVTDVNSTSSALVSQLFTNYF